MFLCYCSPITIWNLQSILLAMLIKRYTHHPAQKKHEKAVCPYKNYAPHSKGPLNNQQQAQTNTGIHRLLHGNIKQELEEETKWRKFL